MGGGGGLSLSIATNGCQPAAAAYFKHQRLISRSSSIQALRLVERALVVEHGSTKVELARPVHGPVSGQVVLPLQGSDSQVAGGDLHFLNSNASCPCWDRYHGVILWRKERSKGSRGFCCFPLKFFQFSWCVSLPMHTQYHTSPLYMCIMTNA